jgi:NAD(P)-dependent dehydrogenase (short-subunit alcohol dehydrogenase family)
LEKQLPKSLLNAVTGFFGTARQPAAVRWAPGTLLRLDVQEESSVAQCMETILSQAKRIDVLVNNAGITIPGSIEDERSRVVAKMRQSIKNGDDPVKVAEAVLQAATAKVPNRKVLVGRGARQARILRTFLPKALFDLGLRRQFGLPEIGRSG